MSCATVRNRTKRRPDKEASLHIDLQETPPSGPFHSSVCIIGAGIAGLSLAMRLAAKGIDVHLLEAGGLQPEERSQALYRAEMVSENHVGANDGRFRTFGGSSTQWGGQILPFTADIFDPPQGSPSLRWPIGEADLAPFYAEVQTILGVDSLPFTDELLPKLGHPAAPRSPDITVRFAKWTPFHRRNLANTLGVEALAHPKVIVFTHANAAQLEALPMDPRRIESVRVINYDRTEFRFSATHFVVCAGTVESSRLLLCSPGVSNAHDQIGRYFHDHVAYHAAELHSPGRERAIDRLGPFYVDGTVHSAKLEASAVLRGREHLLAVMAHVVVMEPDDSGAAAVRNLLRSLQHGKLKEAIFANLLPVLRGVGDVARLVFYSRFRKRRAISKRAVLKLNIDVEQAPDPDNRIRLSETETDAIGLTRTVVDWKVREPELDTALRYAYLIQDYLKALGMETVEWIDSVVQHTSPRMMDTTHMMGGLRMGTDPAASVVSPELTVHGLANLHVASCAVFPSGSSSNPTFTMMALALRLGDRLAAELGAAKS
jgi:choline dehydrogenase-like flavoprotein